MASIKRIRWDAFSADLVHREGECRWPRLAACWDSRSGMSGTGIAVFSPEKGEEIVQAVRADCLEEHWNLGQDRGFVFPSACHPADPERPFVVFSVSIEDTTDEVSGASQDHEGTTLVVAPPWWAEAPGLEVRTVLVHRWENGPVVDLWRARLEVARAVAWFWWRYLTATYRPEQPQRHGVAISREAIQRLREAAGEDTRWLPPFVWHEGRWYQIAPRIQGLHGDGDLIPIPNGDGVILARAEQ